MSKKILLNISVSLLTLNSVISNMQGSALDKELTQKNISSDSIIHMELAAYLMQVEDNATKNGVPYEVGILKSLVEEYGGVGEDLNEILQDSNIKRMKNGDLFLGFLNQPNIAELLEKKKKKIKIICFPLLLME